MPNWCRGVLKIRGKKRDLLKFLKKGIEVIYYKNDGNSNTLIEDSSLKIHNSECESIVIYSENKDYIHVKDTRRCFIVDNIEWFWDSDDKEDLDKLMFS